MKVGEWNLSFLFFVFYDRYSLSNLLQVIVSKEQQKKTNTCLNTEIALWNINQSKT